jgi:hypothetical protein
VPTCPGDRELAEEAIPAGKPQCFSAPASLLSDSGAENTHACHVEPPLVWSAISTLRRVGLRYLSQAANADWPDNSVTLWPVAPPNTRQLASFERLPSQY